MRSMFILHETKRFDKRIKVRHYYPLRESVQITLPSFMGRLLFKKSLWIDNFKSRYR